VQIAVASVWLRVYKFNAVQSSLALNPQGFNRVQLNENGTYVELEAESQNNRGCVTEEF
jgi:hypothetical protein